MRILFTPVMVRTWKAWILSLAICLGLVGATHTAYAQEYKFRYAIGRGPMNTPTGITRDSNGNVYVADSNNNTVLKFTSAGLFVTQWGYAGTGDGQFAFPSGIAADALGFVYVVDTNNSRIQKFTSTGTYVTQWGSGGSGNGLFNTPNGIVTSTDGFIYVSDSGNDRIQKFTNNGTFVSQFGSIGISDGKFVSPAGLALTSTGNVVVADAGNHRIQTFTSSGVFVSKFGLLGTGNGQFDSPNAVTVDVSGNIYVTDTWNHRIQKFTSAGIYSRQYGAFGSNNLEFQYPSAVVVDASGNTYVADTDNNRVQKVNASGVFVTEWGSAANGEGQFFSPYSTALDKSGFLYIADTLNHRIQKFKADGTFVLKFGVEGSGNGELLFPSGVVVDNSGNVFVADTSNHRIQKFSSTGVFLGSAGSNGSGDGQYISPSSLALDTVGNVYVSDTGNNRVQKLTNGLVFVTKFGSAGSANGELLSPAGLAVDSAGNVYVADMGNSRVQKFSNAGTYATQWGEPGTAVGSFNTPNGIAVDAAGLVYVADSGNNRVQVFTSAGVPTTQFGLGGVGVDQLQFPAGISVDSIGTVFVADADNNRIVIWGVKDNIAPVTARVLNPVANVGGWNNVNVIATLTATDDALGWGVKEIRYRVNGGAEQVLIGNVATIPFDTEATHTLDFYAVDKAGNIEVVQNSFVRIDKTAPVTSATTNPAGTLVTLLPTDDRSGVASTVYAVDGGVQQTYVAPFTLIAGTHTIKYGSVDKAGNAEVLKTLSIRPDLQSVTVDPSNVVGGQSTTGTVTLASGAGPTGVTVTLLSNKTNVVVPATVIVPSGATTATFTVTTTSVTVDTIAVISASSAGITKQTNLSVVRTTPGSVAITPGAIIGGNTVSGVVNTNGPAPAGGLVVTLGASDLAASLPATVTVPAGQSSVTFTISTNPVAADTTVSITATANGVAKAGDLSVLRPHLKAISLNRTWTVGGTSKVLRLLLDGKAPVGGIVVALSSDSAVAGVPAAATIVAGQDQAIVTVSTVVVTTYTTVTLSASNSGIIKTIQLDVVPPTVKMRLSPSSLFGGTSAVGTITLDVPAPVGGFTVALASDQGAVTVPTTVTVAAGTNTKTFTVATLPVLLEVLAYVTASTPEQSVEATLLVQPLVPVSVTLTPATVVGGSASTGKLTLSAVAPTGGVVVTLVSDNSAATVPASITVAAGQSFANFNVSTTGVSADTTASVTASASGTSVSGTLVIKAIAPTKVVLTPSTIIGGSSTTGTVTIGSIAPAGGVDVALSLNSSAASTSGSVKVLAGQTTATFVVETSAVKTETTVVVTATANGYSRSGSFVITKPGIVNLTFTPSTLRGGATTTGTITLSGPAPDGGLSVSVVSDNSAVTVPGAVVVARGDTSASFVTSTSSVSTDTTVEITATANGTLKSARIVVERTGVESVLVSPSSVIGGTGADVTVTLTSAAPSTGVLVVLQSNSPSVVLPETVKVQPGLTSATVMATTSAVAVNTAVTLSASANGTSKTATLTVTRATVDSLSVSPTSVIGGGSSTGRVQLSGVAPEGGLLVLLTRTGSAATVPASVTIPAGETASTFSITTSAVTTETDTTVTATANATSKSAVLTVERSGPSTVVINPSGVVGGQSATGTVTLVGAAPIGALVVTLSSDTSGVTVPVTVTVPAGARTATFTVTTAIVAASKAAKITASANGYTATGNILVRPVVPATVLFTPSNITGGSGTTGSVTLADSAPLGGQVVLLVSSHTALGVPSSVLIPAGQTVGTFQATSSVVVANVSATVSATANGVTVTTQVGVKLSQPGSITFTPSVVPGKVSATGTITLATPAPAAGLIVTITSNNVIVAKPAAATVKFLAGQTTGTFAVATTIVAVDTGVVLTATANGASASGNLTVQAARPVTLLFTPSAVRGGLSAIGTVTLGSAAPAAGVTVKLVSGNATVGVPAQVLVPSGKTFVTFKATTSAVTATKDVIVTATANGASAQGTLSVRILTVRDITAAPNPVVGGLPSVGTVTLTDTVSVETVVTLTSSSTKAVVPATVKVPAGKSFATFAITTSVVGSATDATITGTLNGESGKGTLKVTPLLVASVTVTPAKLVGGASATGVVKLTAAPTVDTVVLLTSSNSGVLSVPVSLTIAKGSLQGTFTVTSTKPSAIKVVTVNATTGGVAKTVSVTVSP